MLLAELHVRAAIVGRRGAEARVRLLAATKGAASVLSTFSADLPGMKMVASFNENDARHMGQSVRPVVRPISRMHVSCRLWRHGRSKFCWPPT